MDRLLYGVLHPSLLATHHLRGVHKDTNDHHLGFESSLAYVSTSTPVLALDRDHVECLLLRKTLRTSMAPLFVNLAPA